MNKQIGDMTNDELMDFIIELQEENSIYERKLDQLTNNWNELEEIIRKDHEECKNIYDNFERSVTIYTKGLLDKMNEIKNGGNNG